MARRSVAVWRAWATLVALYGEAEVARYRGAV